MAGVIPREDIDRVRMATDMVALVGVQTQLKRTGSRFMGLCPFHSERTPSFSVNADECLYHCFGCNESGDCFNFVQKTENLEFAEAVEFLADKAGITITRTRGDQSIARRPMIEALVAAQEWYHELLLKSKQAGPARSYLRSRGYGPDEVRRWKLGWAPDAWDALQRHLKADKKVLFKAGLIKKSQRDTFIDVQRARVIFPICNRAGDVIAFGGRALPNSDNTAKYINSPETALYKKSRELFGLHMAKSEIVNRNEVIVAEGYTDVIGLHEMGFSNAVATCGTALTKAHLETLRRFENSKEGDMTFLLAFDPDSSGQTAAARIHNWQSELGLRVEVIDLAEHGDPGDIAETYLKARRALEEANLPAEKTSELQQRLREASKVFSKSSNRHEYLQFRVDRAMGGKDVSSESVDTEQSQTLAIRAARVIADHPDLSVRNKYIVDLSVRMKVSEEDLRRETERRYQSRQEHNSRTYKPNPETTQVAPAQPKGWQQTEDIILSWLCSDAPDKQIPEYLSEELFHNPLNRDIFRALYEYDSYQDILAAGSVDSDARDKIIKFRATDNTRITSQNPDTEMAQLLYNAAKRTMDSSKILSKKASRDGDNAAFLANTLLLSRLKQEMTEVQNQNFSLEAAEEHLVPLLFPERAEQVT